MSEINGVKVPFIPIVTNNDYAPGKVKNSLENFDSIFKEELEKVKFSNHALKRLESRNIQLDDFELNKIESAVNRAELKGSKDSLVMMRDKAFIVNIPNRTVITAMQVGEEQDNVFTNIDSVVFA
ncbi:MAG: TIGR02530 family flagellar biosynthesis protein [Ignavibacteria bacterium]|nr:TIGR02530 family flagellar biosynthesis protein [Ignavibacteria bacterium]MDP3831920.1 TIGR02530 family flagellar biosynthesis protein [Ignavibacteriaceae bacterium]